MISVASILNKISLIELKKHKTPFYASADGYIYSRPIDNVENALNHTSRFYFPLEADTEYWHPEYDINKPHNEVSHTLTVQHRAIAHEQGIILSHPDSAAIARHPLIKTGFSPVDYLNHIGIEASIERCKNPQELPVMEFVIIGFFLVAELYRIVLGEFQEDINKLVVGRRDDSAFIEMGRRLRAYTALKGSQSEENVLMPWVLTLNKIRFQVSISFLDCCAVHGNANYASFCANSGIKLLYKDNFSTFEKSTMNVQYVQQANDFDPYALGDLNCYPALIGNMKNFITIYRSLGIASYFEPPRQTIGATVARMVRSTILKHLSLDLKDKNKVIELCRYGTSAHIKSMRTTTAVYNAKVDGGRCRNNRPTDVSCNRPLADVDIAGCYGNGLKHQDFPFGRPIIIDYPIKSDNNKYYTLRKFLKKFGKELVPGLWQARVSTPKGYTLKYPQDFLLSWIPPKDPGKLPTDTDLESVEWYSEDNIGLIKIFSHEVNLALINQEFLDWLENTASVRQRAELLDNLQVITAVFYPASEKCEKVVDFFQAIDSHKGENLCDVLPKRRGTKKITIEQECHSWMSVNLGDLLVNRLLNERSKYSKSNPDEMALNELYKLVINTIYGDMVSPYFDIGNVVVGNNITARARAMAWYMEKGLNGFQSITDGCAFEINKVVYSDDTRLTSETVLITHGSTINAHYKLKPIAQAERIEVKVGEKGLGLTVFKADNLIEMDNDKAKVWLAEQVSQHLKTIFSGIPVLDKFSFEIKDIYDRAAFHGTANYKFSKLEKTEQGKMRSYSKSHVYNAYSLSGDELQIIMSEYKPSEEFLQYLMNCPWAVPRSHAYIASKILKTGEYKAHYNGKWENSQAFPGCTVESGRLLRECSLTQFTFQTHKQFLSWEREAKRLRDITGQTYESWYLNDDGTLNFATMVIQLDLRIRRGDMRFSSSRESSQHRNLAREYEEHPGFSVVQKCKHQLGIRYGFVDPVTDNFQELYDIHTPQLDELD
jgi:hypothetical protein